MSISDEISRLEQLRSQGSLTEEEFAEAKRQVLSGEGQATSGTHVAGTTDIFCVAEDTWCVLMHLSQLISWSGVGLIAPIVMWLLGKDQSELVRLHGARVMNWLISCVIYAAIGGVLFPFLIGIPILIVVAILNFIFPIMAAIKCHNGELWSYPLAIRLLDEN